MDRRIYDRYVMEVARYGSLKKAAEALGISQPALSSGLNGLENDVGIRIFNRRTIPVSFTPEGEMYFEYIQRIRTLTEDLQRRIRAKEEEADRRVIIGGPAIYVRSIVMDAVSRLRKVEPECRVTIRCASQLELIGMVGRGEVNCFISDGEELPEQFEKIRIRQENLCLCVPRESKINRGVGTQEGLPDYALLDGDNFIFLEEDHPLQRHIMRFMREYEIRPGSCITVNDITAAADLAIRGEGICLIPEDLLKGEPKRNARRVYELPDAYAQRDIYVAYDRELIIPHACGELIRLLSETE